MSEAEENWQVTDGAYGDGERFPDAIQQRLEDSCRKQGWLVPGEKPDPENHKPMGPGSGIGKGWLPYLIQLDEILTLIDPDYQIHQIKEKFGGLRYYAKPSFGSGQHWDQDAKKTVVDDLDDFIRYEAFMAQISSAENKCSHSCEVCGKYAEISGKRWLRCRCDEHKVS